MTEDDVLGQLACAVPAPRVVRCGVGMMIDLLGSAAHPTSEGPGRQVWPPAAEAGGAESGCTPRLPSFLWVASWPSRQQDGTPHSPSQ